MEYCKQCGRINVPQYRKDWDMCVDCAKLYKRYSDLRHKVKTGSIAEANRADKKLMDIVDIYKARAAKGLKVPDTIAEYSAALRAKQTLALCEWCGKTNVPVHSKHAGMCVECGKHYGRFTGARSTINTEVAYYKQQEAKGWRVPVVLKDYR